MNGDNGKPGERVAVLLGAELSQDGQVCRLTVVGGPFGGSLCFPVAGRGCGVRQDPGGQGDGAARDFGCEHAESAQRLTGPSL